MPIRKRETVGYRALVRIQKLCAKYYKEDGQKGEIIQDIWREANFAVIDLQKSFKKVDK